VDVACVYWPAEAERLEHLRSTRVPRLVIVEHGLPPTSPDVLEDWLRMPVDESDLRIRIANLRARAARRASGISIEDGVLRVRDHVVFLPPIETRLATALIERVDAVIGRDALARRGWPGDAPADRTVLDVHIAKLRRLLAGTGVTIRTVHGRGYLMQLVAVEQTSATPS
jgi:two-component system OmpR family response regulator